MTDLKSKVSFICTVIIIVIGIIGISSYSIDECMAGTSGCNESNCPSGDMYVCCTGNSCFIFFGCETYTIMKGSNSEFEIN